MNFMRSTWLAVAGLAGLLAAPTQAGPSPHMRSDFGIVGLARGQTARLHVVVLPAVLAPAPAAPDRNGGEAASDPEWRVELSFVDGAGRPVGRVERRLLRAGQSTYVDLGFGDVAPDSGDRVRFRAVVRAQAPDGGDRTRGHDDPFFLPTLEIFDADTGRSQVVLSPGSTRYFKEVEPGAPAL